MPAGGSTTAIIEWDWLDYEDWVVSFSGAGSYWYFGTTIVSYEWTIDQSMGTWSYTANGVSSVARLPSAGYYTLILKVTDSTGFVNYSYNSIQVYRPQPHAVVTVTAVPEFFPDFYTYPEYANGYVDSLFTFDGSLSYTHPRSSIIEYHWTISGIFVVEPEGYADIFYYETNGEVIAGTLEGFFPGLELHPDYWYTTSSLSYIYHYLDVTLKVTDLYGEVSYAGGVIFMYKLSGSGGGWNLGRIPL